MYLKTLRYCTNIMNKQINFFVTIFDYFILIFFLKLRKGFIENKLSGLKIM